MSTLFPRVADRQSKLAARQLVTVDGRTTVESIFFGGITTPMTCTATVGTTGAVGRTINLTRLAAVTPTGTLGRQVARATTAAAVSAATTARAIARTDRATASTTGMTGRAMTATRSALVATSGALGRLLARTASAGVAVSAAAGLSVQARMASAATTATTFGLSIGHRDTVTVTSAGSIARALTATRTAAVVTTPQIGRQLTRALRAAVTTAGALTATPAGAVRDLIVRLGQLGLKWVTRALDSYHLQAAEPITRWVIGGVAVGLTLPAITTEYLRIPVEASASGVPVNPATTSNAFAFLANLGSEPVDEDWHAGIWNTSSFATEAQILIGPGSGGLPLTAGRYYTWLKIVDSPEIVIRQVGVLVIT